MISHIDSHLRRFIVEDDGATAVEYGLIASLVFLIALVGITQFGQAAETMWMEVANHV